MNDGTHTPGDARTPARLQTIDVSAAGGRPKVLLADLTGDGRMELCCVQGDDIDATHDPHQVISVTVIDLDGEVRWQVGEADPTGGSHGADFPAQIWDFDGDGANEVVCVMDDEFRVIDGRTGEVQRTADLPAPQAHDCIVPVNLTGGDGRHDLLVKDRYHRVWALDNDFDLLWTHEGNTGHYPWPYDVDGDGRDEVMAGYDFLDSDGTTLWSADIPDEHADCIWVADLDDGTDPDLDGSGDPDILIGEGGVYAYSPDGTERWRNREPREVQHIAPGNFREDVDGVQVAGLDRIVRGDQGGGGQDGIFVVDSDGETICTEDRDPGGWLTIVEPMPAWDDGDLDYILAWRRGGGTNPTLYDGHLDPVVTFPEDGYLIHGDLLDRGTEQVIVLEDGTAHVFGDENISLEAPGDGPIAQPKRLANSTLYPGGERPDRRLHDV